LGPKAWEKKGKVARKGIRSGQIKSNKNITLCIIAITSYCSKALAGLWRSVRPPGDWREKGKGCGKVRTLPLD